MPGLPMDSARDKGFASRRDSAREDVRPFSPDFRGDPLEIRIEGFREFLAGGLGPRGPQVPERLDPTTAPLLVMPEIQVRPAADRLGRHATTDLHAPPHARSEEH